MYLPLNLSFYFLLLPAFIISMDAPHASLQQLLLCNPQTILKANIDMYTDFKQVAESSILEKDPTKQIIELNDLCSKYEEKNPIFLIGECTCGRHNRLENSKPRQAFETVASNSLIEKIRSDRKHIPTYISYGSGYMLPDLLILTQTLKKEPRAQLNIHMIDRIYKSIIQTIQGMNGSCRINLDQDLNFNHNKSITNGFAYISYRRFSHMINYLKHEFSQSQLTFFIHKSTNSCAQFFADNHLNAADIITAADIEPEAASNFQTVENYHKLCRNNPKAVTIWLTQRPMQEILNINGFLHIDVDFIKNR